MTQMLVLVGLTVVQLACGTVAPVAAAITTTPAISCNTPLCMGLVGAGVGAAGLAAIGGIAAAAAHKKKAAPTAPPVTAAPFVVTAAPVMLNRNAETTTTAAPSSSGGWLLPLLVGLLLLCCLLGLIGYLCMKPKQKRDTKVKKTTKVKKAVAPIENKAEEAAPLLGTGHWEQPKQFVPVTTAQTSMVPQVTTAQVAVAAAPTYAMQAPAYTEAVVPSYAMMPTQAVAPTAAMLQAYAAPTAVVGTGGFSAGGYGVPTAGYGMNTGMLPSGAIY